jgi:hypothetical protein
MNNCLGMVLLLYYSYQRLDSRTPPQPFVCAKDTQAQERVSKEDAVRLKAKAERPEQIRAGAPLPGHRLPCRVDRRVLN